MPAPGYGSVRLIHANRLDFVDCARVKALDRAFGLHLLAGRKERNPLTMEVESPRISRLLTSLTSPTSYCGDFLLSTCKWHGHAEPQHLEIRYFDDDSIDLKCRGGCHPIVAADALGLDPTTFEQMDRQVNLTKNVAQVVDATIALTALKDPGIFAYGNRLVRLVRTVEFSARQMSQGPSANTTSIHIQALSESTVLDALSPAVSFYELKKNKDGDLVRRPSQPSVNVLGALLGRETWKGIPRLRATVETPVFRPDGSLITEPGFDKDSGLFYAPNCDIPAMPSSPTLEDARKAIGNVLDVISDFPFETPEDRSAWVAAMLTTFVRFVVDGPVPLLLVTANVRGAGKSMLIDVVSIIHTGRRAARTSYTDDDNEMRKRITAVVREGERMVLFDNIAAAFGGPSIDAVLTSTHWQDRVLGKSSTTGKMKISTQWFATGNNTILKGDTGRRSLYVRLDSPQEHPEDRRDFKHSNLIEYVQTHRGELIVSCLTVLRAFFLAGAPQADIAAWGSFEGWDLLRHVMIWLGLPDPKETQAKTRSKYDEEAMALNALCDQLGLLEWLSPGDGPVALSCKDMLMVAGSCGAPDESPEFRLGSGKTISAKGGFSGGALSEAIEALVPMRPGQSIPSARQLGMALGKFEGRVVNTGTSLVRLCVHKVNNLKHYSVERCVQTKNGEDVVEASPVA